MRTARPDYFAGAEAVGAYYTRMDTDEVWGPQPLQSILRQVGVLHKQGVLRSRDASVAYDALASLTSDIRQAAKTGRKSGGGRFRLAAHDLATHATDVVVTGPGLALTIHTLRHPYLATSRRPETAETFAALFDELRAVSRPVSGQAPFAYRPYTEAMLAAIDAVR